MNCRIAYAEVTKPPGGTLSCRTLSLATSPVNLRWEISPLPSTNSNWAPTSCCKTAPDTLVPEEFACRLAVCSSRSPTIEPTLRDGLRSSLKGFPRRTHATGRGQHVLFPVQRRSRGRQAFWSYETPIVSNNHPPAVRATTSWISPLPLLQARSLAHQCGRTYCLHHIVVRAALLATYMGRCSRHVPLSEWWQTGTLTRNSNRERSCGMRVPWAHCPTVGAGSGRAPARRGWDFPAH